jgi:hypothetical protein
MLRLEGEVFRFGTAMAKHSLNQQIHPSGRKLQDGQREKQGAELNRTSRGMQERFQQENASAFSRPLLALSAG